MADKEARREAPIAGPVADVPVRVIGRDGLAMLPKLECPGCGGMFALMGPSSGDAPRCPVCDSRMAEVDRDFFDAETQGVAGGELIPFAVTRDEARDRVERALGKVFLRFGRPSVMMLGCVPVYAPHLACSVSVRGRFDYVAEVGPRGDASLPDPEEHGPGGFIRCLDDVEWDLPRLTRECPSSLPVTAGAMLRPARLADGAADGDDAPTEMPSDILIDIPSDRGMDTARQTMGEDIKRRLVSLFREDATRRHDAGEHKGSGTTMSDPEVLSASVEMEVTQARTLWVPGWAIRLAWEADEGGYDEALLFVHGETGGVIGTIPRFPSKGHLTAALVAASATACLLLAVAIPKVAIVALAVTLAALVTSVLRRTKATGKALGNRGFNDCGSRFSATCAKWEAFADRGQASEAEGFDASGNGRHAGASAGDAYAWH